MSRVPCKNVYVKRAVCPLKLAIKATQNHTKTTMFLRQYGTFDSTTILKHYSQLFLHRFILKPALFVYEKVL